MSGYIYTQGTNSGVPVGDNNPLPTTLSGSNALLANVETTTGLKTANQVSPNGFSSLRLNIWGSGTYDVQVQGTMWDGTWKTLPPSDPLTGDDLSSDITSAGWYEFDVAGMQYVALNVVSITSGNVNAKGALLP